MVPFPFLAIMKERLKDNEERDWVIF